MGVFARVCARIHVFFHLWVGILSRAHRIHTSGGVSAFTHAPRNIISRNIISHIAVMTLGRYVDYTVCKQQAADWVSILPYITSPHSSLCVFFLLPSFFQITSRFPVFLGEVPGYASRWCRVIWWWEGTRSEMNERKKREQARRIWKPREILRSLWVNNKNKRITSAYIKRFANV